MKPHLKPLIRGAAALVLAAAAAACSRDRADAPEVTDSERSAYTPPADSSLTPAQVDLYLRTLLAQLDLVAEEAATVRAQVAAETRRPDMAHWSEYLIGTQVRAARRSGSNPAEMEYVGHRLSAVAGYLAERQTRAASPQVAESFRQQAEVMRGQPGATPAQVQAMLDAAAAAEREGSRPPPPAVAQNLEALRTARGNVTEAMWTRLSSVSGGRGLMSLGDFSDTTATGAISRLAEVRGLVGDAVENRVRR